MKPQLVTSATVFVSHSVPPSRCPNDPAFTLRSITRPVIHSNGSKKKEMRTIIQYMTGRGLLTLPLPEFVLHLPFLIDIWMFRLGVKWVRFGRPTLWLSICVFHFVLSPGYTKNEISAWDDDQSVELLIARWEEKRRTPALGCLCIYLCHMLFCFRQMRPLSCPNDFAFTHYYQLVPWNSNDRYDISDELHYSLCFPSSTFCLEAPSGSLDHAKYQTLRSEEFRQWNQRGNLICTSDGSGSSEIVSSALGQVSHEATTSD